MAQTFYASSKINRHGDYRSDPQILNKIMIDMNTKFVPLYKGKNLFKQISNNCNYYSNDNVLIWTYLLSLK